MAPGKPQPRSHPFSHWCNGLGWNSLAFKDPFHLEGS